MGWGPPQTRFQPRYRSGAQPIGAAEFVAQRQRLAGDERGGDGFHPVGIGDPPPGRRPIEREAEPQIARRGDRRDTAKCSGQLTGDGVGAMMPAQQWHRGRSVLGERDDRRFDVLVIEERRQCADKDAGGA